MSSICNPSCITALPNFGSIDVCDLSASFTSGEIAKIILTRCDVVFDDILDDAEWTAKKTANIISIPFQGTGNIGETTYSTTKRIGCKTISINGVKPFEFMTSLVDNITNSEWALWNDIQNNRSNLNIMFLTCDNQLLINPRWVAGENPSISLKSINVSQLLSGEEDSLMEYKVSGELKEDLSLNRITLTPTVLAVINA
jgi:hypothetical protein